MVFRGRCVSTADDRRALAMSAPNRFCLGVFGRFSLLKDAIDVFQSPSPKGTGDGSSRLLVHPPGRGSPAPACPNRQRLSCRERGCPPDSHRDNEIYPPPPTGDSRTVPGKCRIRVVRYLAKVLAVSVNQEQLPPKREHNRRPVRRPRERWAGLRAAARTGFRGTRFEFETEYLARRGCSCQRILS